MKKQQPPPDKFIEAATLQTVVIGQQSITLYLPDVAAVQAAYRRGSIPFPYWSKVWPAAIALSEFIIRHPYYVQNKKVLEAGAGLGLPSLVAARYASQVLCTDGAVEATSFAQRSAEHQHLKNFETSVMDWRHLPVHLSADVLLLSDINYDPASFEAVYKLITIFLAKGATLLLSTPQRLMAKEFIASLLADCKRQEELRVVQDGKEVVVTILVLKKEGCVFIHGF